MEEEYGGGMKSIFYVWGIKWSRKRIAETNCTVVLDEDHETNGTHKIYPQAGRNFR